MVALQSLAWRNPEPNATKVSHEVWEDFQACWRAHYAGLSFSEYLSKMVQAGLDHIFEAPNALAELEAVAEIFQARHKTLKPHLTPAVKERISDSIVATGMAEPSIIGGSARIGYRLLCRTN